APGGALLVIEPLAADRFEDDFANPYARIGYAISTMACLPSGTAQAGPAQLGAMAGEAKLREILAAGGFTDVRRIVTPTAPFNILLGGCRGPRRCPGPKPTRSAGWTPPTRHHWYAGPTSPRRSWSPRRSTASNGSTRR